jgi:hypothetical protein
MIAFITVCQGECEYHEDKDNELVVEVAPVGQRKYDRVLAKI